MEWDDDGEGQLELDTTADYERQLGTSGYWFF